MISKRRFALEGVYKKIEKHSHGMISTRSVARVYHYHDSLKSSVDRV